MAKDYVETPMTQHKGHNSTGQPTGHVCTDGKATTIRDLPERTMGKDSLKEVTYDENVGLPDYPKK